MPYQRDPLSELFDDAARRLLARAYANPGRWAATRLADPTMAHIRFANSHGIYPESRDTAPGGEARTRWGRAFVRSLYYQHKWWSAGGSDGWRDRKRTAPRESGGLVVEVGRRLPGGAQAGTLLRPGRAVRVKLERGGQAKAAAVARMSNDRTWADQGPRWADPGDRDW